jgi:hypothetical protein
MTELDVDAAFRAGVRGLGYVDPALIRDPIVISERPPGEHERFMAATDRVPGLTDPRAAYRTGRALRGIGALLDTTDTPVGISQQIRATIAGAVLVHYMRDSAWPWGEVATINLFIECARSSIAAGGFDVERIRNALLDYARREPTMTLAP